MQSIKSCKTSSNSIFFVYVILADILTAYGVLTCGLYGALPCEFLPAPPGQTPKCARPGKTYCEHVDNYPIHRIKELVHKWGYEAKNLLVDETWDDFAAVAWHDTPVFYDPISIFPTRPNYPSNEPNFNGYKYETPTHSAAAVSAQIHQRYGNNRHAGGGVGNAPSTTYLIQTNKLHPNSYPQQHHHQPRDASSIPSYLLYSSAAQRFNHNEIGKTHNNNVTPNNPTLWLKRIVRDLSERQSLVGIRATNFTSSSVTARPRHTRDVSLNMDLLDIVGVQRPTQHQSQQQRARTKRQSPGRSTLCPTTSQFITPQAALNSKGNWMFVVNEANTARQMVKAELCTSNTCTNICELPNGYNSRCEQKFVQKRLIALQGNGQNLYTDTFWFPSCCVCTIAAN